MCNPDRGLFIVIEGLDRSGKSTTCLGLKDSLESLGKKVKLIKFPRRETEIGNILSLYLNDKTNLTPQVAHLLFSTDRWAAQNEIKSWLNEGYYVISDRYAYSGVAYSVGVQGLDFEWAKQPDAGIISPDLAIFLNISAEVTSKREGFGTERLENIQVQKRVYNIFQLFKGLSNWISIDASKNKDEVKKQALDIILSTKPSRMETLWH